MGILDWFRRKAGMSTVTPQPAERNQAVAVQDAGSNAAMTPRVAPAMAVVSGPAGTSIAALRWPTSAPRSRATAVPKVGADAASCARGVRRPCVIKRIQANGRRLIVEHCDTGRRYGFTLRADGTYRLEAAPPVQTTPRLELAADR